MGAEEHVERNSVMEEPLPDILKLSTLLTITLEAQERHMKGHTTVRVKEQGSTHIWSAIHTIYKQSCDGHSHFKWLTCHPNLHRFSMRTA